MYKNMAVDDDMVVNGPFAAAGPMPDFAPAAAAGSGTLSTASAPKVRTEFPETWIWAEQIARYLILQRCSVHTTEVHCIAVWFRCAILSCLSKYRLYWHID